LIYKRYNVPQGNTVVEINRGGLALLIKLVVRSVARDVESWLALILATAILFAAEPTGSLDPATAKSVMQLMRAGITPRSSLIMVTHDFDLAATADRVIVLADGVNHAALRHPTSEQLFELMQQAS
jgi:putative ABC transport system ATP-binding protein